jgi:DNA-binding transcriptional ArsR family regulator
VVKTTCVVIKQGKNMQFKPQKSEKRLKIERALAECPMGLTRDEMIERLELTAEEVSSVVVNLKSCGMLESSGPRRTPRYKLAKPKSVEDVAAKPVKNGTSSGFYDGAELRPYDGRPGANDHMQFGSVTNGKWTPYKPPGLMCVGAAGPVPVSIGTRRFAV